MKVLFHCSLFFFLLLNNNIRDAKSWTITTLSEQKSTSHSSTAQGNRKEFLVQAGIAVACLVGAPWDVQAAASNKKIPPYIQERGSLESGLGPCPGQPMKKSCWSSEDNESRKVERWEAPASIKGDSLAIAKELEETMSLYPKEGQNDVDRGGWTLAERNTEGKATYLRYEFTSGKFKYIDELELLVDSTGKVSVRTASRNAGFDYNVNATRLNYIQKALAKKGWKVKMV